MRSDYVPDYENISERAYQQNLSKNELYVLALFNNPDSQLTFGFRDGSKKELIEYFAQEFEISLSSMKKIFKKLEEHNLLTIVEQKICSFK